jgi:hypothetical protein
MYNGFWSVSKIFYFRLARKRRAFVMLTFIEAFTFYVQPSCNVQRDCCQIKANASPLIHSLSLSLYIHSRFKPIIHPLCVDVKGAEQRVIRRLHRPPSNPHQLFYLRRPQRLMANATKIISPRVIINKSFFVASGGGELCLSSPRTSHL